MSLSPLLRLLAALFTALALRALVSGIALWCWTSGHSLTNLEVMPLLLTRWGVGILGMLVLGVMAWQSAKIRSTQSATGILYVAVIFCFLGELLSLVLFRMTRSIF